MTVNNHGFLEFECDCLAKRGFEFVKPTLGTPTLKAVRCEGCGSEWEVRIRATVIQGAVQLAYTHRLIRGTGRLADALQKKKVDELLNRPQPKAPLIFVPRGFKT
jgi:hypothetical protein